MNHPSNADTLLVAAYWLLLIPIAAFILIKVNGFVIDDFPTSFARAMGLVLATAAVAFFAFDLSGYALALFMQDPVIGIRLPPGYSYWNWLQEPLALKWRVLSFVPFIRFIPVGIAVIIASIMQIFVWKITFPFGLLIVLGQLFFTVGAMVLLSFAFRVGIVLYARHAAEAARPHPAEHRHPERHDPKSEPADLAELEHRVRHVAPEADTLWHRLDRQWESVNGHLAPLYRWLQPVTDHFPPAAQDWLNAGGWVALPAGLAALAFAWPRIRRGRKHPKHHRRTHPA